MSRMDAESARARSARIAKMRCAHAPERDAKFYNRYTVRALVRATATSSAEGAS